MTDGGFAKRSRISDYRQQSRGGLGIKAMTLTNEQRGGLVGINHHGGHGGRAGQQGNGQWHHRNAVAHGGFFGARFQRALIRAGFGRPRIEHVHGADEQQQATADLKAFQRNIEEIQHLQPHQRTGSNHHKRAEGGGADGLGFLLRIKPLGVVNEKRHDGQRVHDGDQGDQRL